MAFLIASFLLTVASSATAAARHTFAIGTNDFLLDGQRFQIRCGEIHAARVPREYWRHRLQMAKAMGLNTVCAYLFWNQIEPEPGKFDWSGQADVAEFCRIAQQEGLWVILRPGPYSCAEWEMGGLPWWLLKYDGIKLRTADPRYLDAARRYLKEVGRELGPLQITRGGPILMVQVENEYGSFGKDAAYMGDVRQALLDAGFTVPLFACNPAKDLKNGFRADLFPVVNFGSDPEKSFKALREILPQGPLMCGEFYPGWFDWWGAPHHTGKTAQYLADLEYMLQHGESFSIYMVHGGTTFGLWSGADHPFKPDTSSYDYDAPISEAGWPTEKFWRSRELFSKYLLPGETLPKPPPTNATIEIDSVDVSECAPVFANLPKAITDKEPGTMEQYDQAHGCILYRTTVPAGKPALLEAASVHDFGFVFLEGRQIGIMDRRTNLFSIKLPERKSPATLDIFVEAVGRVNFGQEIHDRKGIHAPVKLGGSELTDWKVFKLPLDKEMLAGLHFRKVDHEGPVPIGPAFWRATVEIEKPGDCFLEPGLFGKGVVWVNGHCLGRFWDIGPTQTAYVPGPWLKRGKNEFVIFDLIGPRLATLSATSQPILNDLHPQDDFSRRPPASLVVESAGPVQTGSFTPGTAMQEVKFNAPAKGRYFCIEALNDQDGGPDAAIAELVLLDASGKQFSNERCTVAYADSEEHSNEDGSAKNAVDGQTTSFWHTQWSADANFPHRLILDLGKSQTLSGFRYVPRQGADDVPGRIKNYRIFVGDTLLQYQ